MDGHNKPREMMWRPDPNKITTMDKFRSFVNTAYDLKLGEYAVDSIVSYPGTLKGFC